MTTQEQLRLTEHEILALLAFNEGESTAITREIFRLTPVVDNEHLVKAGMTTLLVREFAELKDGDLVVQGPAEFLTAVMATAGEWLEIALITPATSHVMFAVASAGGAFVANVFGDGTLGLSPLKNDRPVLGFGMDAAEHYLRNPEQARPVAAQIKHHGIDTEARTANLMVDETGQWHLATGEGPGLVKQEVAEEEAFTLFAQALDLDQKESSGR